LFGWFVGGGPPGPGPRPTTQLQRRLQAAEASSHHDDAVTRGATSSGDD
jgi:hypothetical protein